MRSRLTLALSISLISYAATGASSQDSGGQSIRWNEPQVASPQFESHAAFDPSSGDLYFVRSTKKFSHWRIMLARCTRSGLASPVSAPFAGQGVEADPAFSPDGQSLWYISTRASGSDQSKDLDIWMVSRKGSGWSRPARLPHPINSDHAEWFPRLSGDGWLYFGSNRPGGFGGNDIWRARKKANQSWQVENAGPAINTSGDEYEPLPSPDGKQLLIEASDGYYISKLTWGRWSPRERLGSAINANGSEVGAVYSPSGNSVMFARNTGGPASGDFFIWRLGRIEKWPDICPKPNRRGRQVFPRSAS